MAAARDGQFGVRKRIRNCGNAFATMVREIGVISLIILPSFAIDTKHRQVCYCFIFELLHEKVSDRNFPTHLFPAFLLVEKARENIKTRWRKLEPASHAAIEYPPHDWLADEDSALKYAVSVHGKDWRKILGKTKVLQDLVEHLPGEQYVR